MLFWGQYKISLAFNFSQTLTTYCGSLLTFFFYIILRLVILVSLHKILSRTLFHRWMIGIRNILSWSPCANSFWGVFRRVSTLSECWSAEMLRRKVALAGLRQKQAPVLLLWLQVQRRWGLGLACMAFSNTWAKGYCKCLFPKLSLFFLLPLQPFPGPLCTTQLNQIPPASHLCV